MKDCGRPCASEPRKMIGGREGGVSKDKAFLRFVGSSSAFRSGLFGDERAKTL